MDSVGDRRSYEERGAEKHMDEYLRSIGLHRKKIAKDGSCLFRAVAEQVLHCQSFHIQVRTQCVEYLRQNREKYEAFIEGDFEDYLYKLRDPQQWVGEVEINALAMMYKRDFWIFQEPGKAAVNITDKNFKDRVQLCFLNGNHYDCVYPISRVKNTAVCQSILYELLYDNVCHVDRGLLGVCHRTPKPSDALIDDCLAPCPSSGESDTEDRQENGTCAAVVKSKGRGRGRFMSERVRRSLNPTLLRNVQFDLWLKSKKAQQKMDFCIAAGMQYSVGDRCQVRVDSCGQVYNATVKKLSPNDNGPVTVYSDQLGEIEVPLWKLRPPNETSWSTVVREKRVTNGHGEWEERGRGRGRGKPTPAPPGVPQATAPPGGRISKQHSWPPQASADEREASSRKSDSVSFGLTEKQRLAREEEERNAALVELRFPDDRSFPALGTQAGVQSEAGKKRGSEKKRLQKNTRRSPVEENGSTSPLPSPSVPAPPPSSVTPPASDAAAPQPSGPSYASAAGPVLPVPPQSRTAPPLARPALPAASSVPALSSFPKASSPPTFIAPIAPSPAAAQSLMGRVTPSPPGSAVTHNPPAVTEAPVQTASATSHLSSAPAPRSDISVSELHVSASDLQLQNQVPNQIQDQVQAPVPQPQTAPPPLVRPAAPQIQPLPQPEPVHFPQSQIPLTSAAAPTPFHPPSLPQNESPVPAALPSPPPHSQPRMEHPNSAPNPSPDLPVPPSPEQPAPQQLQYPFPLHHQLSLYYQDPLYPGFPLGDKGQVAPVPPMSTSQSGDDLPRDMNVLRFFFNLGLKSYSLPMHPPLVYLLPLQQAHSLQPRAPSRSPSPVYHHPAAAPAYPPFHPPQPSPPGPSDPCQPATPYQEANLHDQAPPNAFNPAHSTPQAPLAAQNPPHSTQAPPHSAYNPDHDTQAPPHSAYNPDHDTQAPPHSAYNPPHNTQAPPQSVYNAAQNTQGPPQSMYSPAHNTQAPPQSVYSPAHNTQAPPQSVYSPAHNTQAPPQSLYSPAHNTQAPPQSLYSPAHNTQAPPHSVYSPAHNTQAPPQSLYSPAHNTQAPLNSAFNPPHNTQTPPTAYNAANANSEAPPSSYTRSTPQQIPPTAFEAALPNPQPPPSAYSPSRPSQPPASDAPYPQSYPQHLQWQPSQAYAVNYQYNQAYYHHQQPQPANGDTVPGLRAARLPAALEGSASANAGNVNGGQMQMLPGVTGFGHSNPDVGENMMLLVDPPLDKPIVINVPKPSSGSASPALYSPAHSSDSSNIAPFYMSHHKSSPSYHRPANPNAPAFVPASHAAPPFIPTSHSAAFLQGPELLSVSVGTEEDWDEPEDTRPTYRGQRRGGGGYRSRGRGQYRARGYNNQYYNHRGSRGRY